LIVLLFYPCILQSLLGDDYEVIEDGLGARTTFFDDPRPEFPSRNGASSLPIILEKNLPLEYVIIMLGTTDTKPLINKSPEEIGEGARSLITIIKGFRLLGNTSLPKILLVVPPIVDDTTLFASSLFQGGTKKALLLPSIYKRVAQEEGVLYLDVTPEVKVDSKEDGVHINKENHKRLAQLIEEKIKEEEKRINIIGYESIH